MAVQTNSLTSSATEIDGNNNCNDSLIVDKLCKNFENEPHSITVESKDEDSYVLIPEILTFAETTDILNQAIKESNYEKLDNVIQNIEDYEGQSITLDNENLKNFCLNQLNLDLQSRSDHRHIYSNILSQYSFDQVECNCNYPAKELVLLAIAANDELTEKYQDILFTERNLSLLPLLIGSEKYIEIFIGKFPDLYQSLKNQTIQLENGQIGFFSVIALRQKQELLNTVLIEYVLRDLEQVLKTTSPDPAYDILETASLAKNRNFMEIVLDSLERCVDDQTKKDLFKKYIVTFLETAVSQEHVSIVEYLCRERIEKKGPIIQEIYKEAFTDEKIVAQIDTQILKNIHSAGVGRKEEKQKIYDLILKAASHTGSTDFIVKVLDLIKNGPKFLGDTDRRTFLQNSLVTILDNAIGENSKAKFLTIQQIYHNACHTPISVDNSVASQLNEKEPNGDDSNLEQDEFEITDIQEEQRPGVLGLNKTEIAGFSQEKLLEIINFIKVSYYVGDCNLNNKKFSELKGRFYRVPAQLKEVGYKIIQFYNMHDNGQPYRHAGYAFIKDNEITIVYRGSRNSFDYAKDFEIPLTNLPRKLVPKGGKVHSGFYSLFKDSWESVYKILKGYANDQRLKIKDFKINLAGHSMGGAIAIIAALHLSVEEGAEDLHVATVASPRSFDPSAAKVYEERLGKNTIRVVNQSDFIPSLLLGSMGYKHVGEQLRISSSSLLYAHTLDVYRNLIVNIEPDKFKSDNSVSIYYYPSYFLTVLYNVLTAPSYLIPNTHSNGDEQYFKQVKNKHKDASLSEMMKYSGSSNEQKVVIYEDSEPGEDGFITFHTLRNAIGEKNLLTILPIFNPNIEFRITKSLIDNLFAMMPSLHRYGRSKWLKVNVSDISFFVNNNYYLSGDTISLRLLETLVDNSLGRLALKSANSQRVEEVGSAATNDQSTSIISNNGIDNIQQEPTIVLKESGELAAQTVQDTSVRDGVTKNDNVVASVSSDDNHSDSSKIQLDESRTGSDQVSNQSTGHITQMDDERAPLSEGNSQLKSGDDKQDLQSENLTPDNIVISSLHYAAMMGYTGEVKYLIEEVGADINEKDKYGRTPLHRAAARRYNEETLQFLLNKGAEFDEKDDVGMTPLCLAIVNDCEKIVKTLVARGADVNVASKNGNTPLHWLVISRHTWDDLCSDTCTHTQIKDFLLNNGANHLLRNNDGRTPEDLAKKKENLRQQKNGITSSRGNKQPSSSVSAESEDNKKTGIQFLQEESDDQLQTSTKNKMSLASVPNSNESTPTIQSTKKSKWPVVVATTLAITGVATGIAIAVYLEMLAVGIAVGVCCLVAAAIIYYCNMPSNSLEKSSVEAVGVQEEGHNQICSN